MKAFAWLASLAIVGVMGADEVDEATTVESCGVLVYDDDDDEALESLVFGSDVRSVRSDDAVECGVAVPSVNIDVGTGGTVSEHSHSTIFALNSNE